MNKKIIKQWVNAFPWPFPNIILFKFSLESATDIRCENQFHSNRWTQKFQPIIIAWNPNEEGVGWNYLA